MGHKSKKWIKNTNGTWSLVQKRKIDNSMLGTWGSFSQSRKKRTLEVISEEEYFKRKLAGQLHNT